MQIGISTAGWHRREYDTAIAKIPRLWQSTRWSTIRVTGSDGDHRARRRTAAGPARRKHGSARAVRRAGDSSEVHRVLGLIYRADSDLREGHCRSLTTAIRLSPQTNARATRAIAGHMSSAGKTPRLRRASKRRCACCRTRRWRTGVWRLSHERVNRFADARREFALAAAGAVDGEKPAPRAGG